LGRTPQRVRAAVIAEPHGFFVLVAVNNSVQDQQAAIKFVTDVPGRWAYQCQRESRASLECGDRRGRRQLRRTGRARAATVSSWARRSASPVQTPRPASRQQSTYRPLRHRHRSVREALDDFPERRRGGSRFGAVRSYPNKPSPNQVVTVMGGRWPSARAFTRGYRCRAVALAGTNLCNRSQQHDEGDNAPQQHA
jgi:hypothetical protein